MIDIGKSTYNVPQSFSDQIKGRNLVSHRWNQSCPFFLYFWYDMKLKPNTMDNNHHKESWLMN